jgi:hypothetical protein
MNVQTQRIAPPESPISTLFFLWANSALGIDDFRDEPDISRVKVAVLSTG